MTLQINKIESSSVGDGSRAGYELPDTADTNTTRQFFADRINELVTEVNNLKGDLRDNKSQLERQSSRNIEIIGIFSAVLALLIIDTSIIKSVVSFLAAILLIAGMTASLAIFLILTHEFFDPQAGTRKIGKYFWIPFSVLIILIIVGLVTYGWNNKLIIVSGSSSQTATSMSP